MTNSRGVILLTPRQSLVVACGVRKQWVKVFEGLDQPSQQISKLQQILADLGMEGRLSLEKAKAIKEKRDFEKELGTRIVLTVHRTS